MHKKKSKWLVIDASVARASGGGNAVFPTSKHCRDFLQATEDICHHAVITKGMKVEWDNHQSRFARRWQRSMMAKRKLHIIDVVSDAGLRERISRVAAKAQDRDAMLKDAHLLEAAITHDRIVISLDESARVLFIAAAVSVGEIKRILWANPDRIEEDCAGWLARGARHEKKRQ